MRETKVMNLEQVRQRRAEIGQVASRYGAHDVRIFGSVARGDESPESDVDVLVRFEPGRSLLDLVGIRQDLEELLCCRVDVVSERALQAEDEILREAITL